MELVRLLLGQHLEKLGLRFISTIWSHWMQPCFVSTEGINRIKKAFERDFFGLTRILYQYSKKMQIPGEFLRYNVCENVCAGVQMSIKEVDLDINHKDGVKGLVTSISFMCAML